MQPAFINTEFRNVWPSYCSSREQRKARSDLQDSSARLASWIDQTVSVFKKLFLWGSFWLPNLCCLFCQIAVSLLRHIAKQQILKRYREAAMRSHVCVVNTVFKPWHTKPLDTVLQSAACCSYVTSVPRVFLRWKIFSFYTNETQVQGNDPWIKSRPKYKI